VIENLRLEAIFLFLTIIAFEKTSFHSAFLIIFES